MNKIFDGKEGLAANYKFVFSIPSAFGIIRLILLTVFLRDFETPQYWMDRIDDESVLASKVMPLYSYFYESADAKKMMEQTIRNKRLEKASTTSETGLL